MVGDTRSDDGHTFHLGLFRLGARKEKLFHEEVGAVLEQVI